MSYPEQLVDEKRTNCEQNEAFPRRHVSDLDAICTSQVRLVLEVHNAEILSLVKGLRATLAAPLPAFAAEIVAVDEK
jgi:hypothetical protein